MATTKLHTIEDLEQMDGEIPYELIRGVLHEVTPCSIKPSMVGVNITGYLFIYLRSHKFGFLTGSDGGFVLSRNPDTMVAPDVGFIRAERLPNGVDFSGFCPIPPDFAVEVMSPSDRPREVAEKIALYQEAGVPLIWWVKPEERIVAVYRAGQHTRDYHDGDELDGEPVLPGFRLAVRDVFDL
jgi:Uma2 family endonuclease